MPLNRSRTLNLTCMIPVKAPIIIPTAKDMSMEIYGFIPPVRRTAVTAAPAGKLPSVVRSGKSSILYVI